MKFCRVCILALFAVHGKLRCLEGTNVLVSCVRSFTARGLSSFALRSFTARGWGSSAPLLTPSCPEPAIRRLLLLACPCSWPTDQRGGCMQQKGEIVYFWITVARKQQHSFPHFRYMHTSSPLPHSPVLPGLQLRVLIRLKTIFMILELASMSKGNRTRTHFSLGRMLQVEISVAKIHLRSNVSNLAASITQSRFLPNLPASTRMSFSPHGHGSVLHLAQHRRLRSGLDLYPANVRLASLLPDVSQQ